jgi:hypothetical protein
LTIGFFVGPIVRKQARCLHYFIDFSFLTRKNVGENVMLNFSDSSIINLPLIRSIRVLPIPEVRAKNSDYKLSVLINRLFVRMLAQAPPTTTKRI